MINPWIIHCHHFFSYWRTPLFVWDRSSSSVLFLCKWSWIKFVKNILFSSFNEFLDRFVRSFTILNVSKSVSRHAAHAAKALRWRLLKCLIKKRTLIELLETLCFVTRSAFGFSSMQSFASISFLSIWTGISSSKIESQARIQTRSSCSSSIENRIININKRALSLWCSALCLDPPLNP